jgi:hypothetical protein
MSDLTSGGAEPVPAVGSGHTVSTRR